MKLFRYKPRDGLSQVQREAILDLLALGIYVDDYMSRTERSELKKISSELDWQGEQSISRYLEEKLAVIASLEGDVAYEAMLSDIAQRLGDAKTKRRGLELCEKIIFADGSEHRIEDGLITEIRRIFNV